MRNVLAIAWREIRTYFTSPLAYVVIGVFVALTGYIFWAHLVRFSDVCLRFGSNPYVMNQLNVNDMVVRPLFGTMGIIFLLIIPALSMRLFAEERKSGTAELLFTSPVTSLQVILGKFLGSAFLVLVMVGITLAYPLLILASNASPEIQPTLAGYFGVFLMALAFLSLGVLISSMTENQIIAAVGTFGASLAFWILPWIADTATVTLASLANMVTLGLWDKLNLGLAGPTLGDLLKRISLVDRMKDFQKGLFDTDHLVFYLCFVFFSLFLTQRVIDSQRWRG